jgi:hypothetical protein
MIRALRLAGLVLALALASFGAWAVNQPVRPHGPMGFSLASPVRALALVFGMGLLRAFGRNSAVYALAALLMALCAGYNFYFYPPIPDGAYFLVRYGHTDAGELWPAAAVWHVIGFAGVAWSLALVFGGPPVAGRRGLAEAALLVLLIAAGSILLELFTQTLPGATVPWRWAAPWLAGLIAVAAGFGWLGRRRALTRLAAAFCALLTLLTVAMLALYQIS